MFSSQSAHKKYIYLQNNEDVSSLARWGGQNSREAPENFLPPLWAIFVPPYSAPELNPVSAPVLT